MNTFQVDPEIFDYSNPTLKVIRTNCHLEGFLEYIRLADRRLLVQIKGTLFIFTPVMNY